MYAIRSYYVMTRYNNASGYWVECAFVPFVLIRFLPVTKGISQSERICRSRITSYNVCYTKLLRCRLTESGLLLTFQGNPDKWEFQSLSYGLNKDWQYLI